MNPISSAGVHEVLAEAVRLHQAGSLGEADRLYRHARHPYTVALLAAVPSVGGEPPAARRPLLLAGEPPSAHEPPSGCRFHPRCPRAQPRCAIDEPALAAPAGGPSEHAVACHFPVADGGAVAPAAGEPP